MREYPLPWPPLSNADFARESIKHRRGDAGDGTAAIGRGAAFQKIDFSESRCTGHSCQSLKSPAGYDFPMVTWQFW